LPLEHKPGGTVGCRVESDARGKEKRGSHERRELYKEQGGVEGSYAVLSQKAEEVIIIKGEAADGKHFAGDETQAVGSEDALGQTRGRERREKARLWLTKPRERKQEREVVNSHWGSAWVGGKRAYKGRGERKRKGRVFSKG